MSDEQVKKALIGTVVVIVLIFLIIFIVRITSRVSPGKEQAKIEKEKQKQIAAIESGKITGKYDSKLYNYEYLNLTQEQRTIIDEVIDYVLELINKHDTETIWDMLNRKYRNELLPDKEYLKKYLEKNFPSNKEFKSFGYELKDETLFMTIGSDTKSGDEDDMKFIRIDGYDKERKVLYFGKYSFMEEIKIMSDKDKYTLNSYTLIHYDDETSIVFRLTNKTDAPLHLDFFDCFVYVQNARSYKKYALVDDVESFDVDAKGMEICEVRFEPFAKAAQKLDLKVRVDRDDAQTYEANNIYFAYSGAQGD